MLPDQSGLELCRPYAAASETDRIPIVIFFRPAATEERALATGAADFLKMPCQSQEPPNLLENWGSLVGIAAPAERADISPNGNPDEPLILLVDKAKSFTPSSKTPCAIAPPACSTPSTAMRATASPSSFSPIWSSAISTSKDERLRDVPVD